MRVFSVIVAVAGSVVMASAAHAFENFIPAGTGYSTEIITLPELNSDQSKLNQQTDIYETEIYRKQRKYAEDDAKLRRFFSQNDSTGLNGKVDY
jgi:hypothetical protein